MRRVLASFGRLGLGVLFLSATCQRAAAFAGMSPLRLAHIPRSAALASLSPAPRLRQPYSHPVMTGPVVATGDLVAVKWGCTTADGKALPESAQVFDQGSVRLVVGEGGFLSCLHKKVVGMKEGETEEFEVMPAEAFGESNPMMGPVDLPASAAPPGLKAGMVVQLSNGAKARVTKVTDQSITIDANPPLAGETIKLNVQVLAVEPGATSLERADFAIGCFWGAELAYQREPGVIATKVGYTQGKMLNPTYEQVCSGSTGHTECVQVMYDPKEVTYARLCDLFWERLGESRFLKNQVGNDRGTQYRHGIYWHSDEQKQVAEASMAAIAAKNSARAVETELAKADKFWNAEEYHMQYLQKGGQDARKAATQTIRCYG